MLVEVPPRRPPPQNTSLLALPLKVTRHFGLQTKIYSVPCVAGGEGSHGDAGSSLGITERGISRTMGDFVRRAWVRLRLQILLHLENWLQMVRKLPRRCRRRRQPASPARQLLGGQSVQPRKTIPFGASFPASQRCSYPRDACIRSSPLEGIQWKHALFFFL